MTEKRQTVVFSPKEGEHCQKLFEFSTMEVHSNPVVYVHFQPGGVVRRHDGLTC